MYKIIGNEDTEIIGLRVLQDVDAPLAYTIYVAEERPIFFDKRLIIFFDLNNADKALRKANCGAERLSVPSVFEQHVVFDYFRSINTLSEKGCKNINYSTFVSCLNFLEDIYFSTMPKRKRICDPFFKKIFSASFYFFDNDEIDPFFIQEGYDRKELVDAIEHVIGKTLLTAKYIF
ncbi:MAG: hypothetical protein ACRC2T_02005 [Thermoguttaceae bacterium]